MLGEFDIIRRYFSRDPRDEGVELGVGDDAALLRPSPGVQLVVAVDALVEGVHYPAGLAAADVGFRAVAVNLSDIAAMGGRPRWMTLALTLRSADEAWIAAFSDGLYTAADAHSVSLVGGDTTRGDQVVACVQLIGEVPAGLAIVRSGAAAGDDIYVSGTVGDAAAGLALLQSGGESRPATETLLRRFRRPDPRLALGAALRGHASAAIDVSDGLHDDLGKLLHASRRGALLDLERLPLSPALREAFPDDALRFALAGGDDYELCFTAPPSAAAAIAAAADASATAVTRIGEITDGGSIECRQHGEALQPELGGYDHFSSRGHGQV